MNEPSITLGKAQTLVDAINLFAPEQGGIEFQTDQPGKVHSWHSHSVKETLVILEGRMTFQWMDSYPSCEFESTEVGPGAVIELPANLIHQSINHDDVCRYLILPEGGRAAKTKVFGSNEE